MRVNLCSAISSQPEVCAMVSISSTPGISGWPGNGPRRSCWSVGTVGLSADRPVVRSSVDDPVDQLEVFEPHRSLGVYCRAHALGGDQLVDAGAEVLQHEILLGRRLAVVDLLGPLLERQLDAERLVDGERDVEEVEAVDAEIVDGVAVRL